MLTEGDRGFKDQSPPSRNTYREWELDQGRTGLIDVPIDGAGIVINEEIGLKVTSIEGPFRNRAIVFCSKFDDPITIIDRYGKESMVRKQANRAAYKTSAFLHRKYTALIYSNELGVRIEVRIADQVPLRVKEVPGEDLFEIVRNRS